MIEERTSRPVARKKLTGLFQLYGFSIVNTETKKRGNPVIAFSENRFKGGSVLLSTKGSFLVSI